MRYGACTEFNLARVLLLVRRSVLVLSSPFSPPFSLSPSHPLIGPCRHRRAVQQHQLGVAAAHS